MISKNHFISILHVEALLQSPILNILSAVLSFLVCLMTLSTAQVYLARTVKLQATVDGQVRRHTGCYKVQYVDMEESNQNPRHGS